MFGNGFGGVGFVSTVVSSNAALVELSFKDKNGMGSFVGVNSTVSHIISAHIFLAYTFQHQ